MKHSILYLKKWNKMNQGMSVLKDFDLTLYRNEITYVAASKYVELDTISDLLAGRDQIDEGDSFINEQKSNTVAVQQWLYDHVSCVSAEETFVPNLSIMDNFFVCSREKQPFFVKEKRNFEALSALVNRFDIAVNLYDQVDMLTDVQKYQIKILKAWFYSNEKILLIDIRPIALSDDEFIDVMKFLSKLKETGTTILLLGYYNLSAIKKSDSLVVISNGRSILQRDVKLLSEKDLMQMNDVDIEVSETNITQQIALTAKEIYTRNLLNVSFSVYAHEVTNIYYKQHSIARELFDVLIGRLIVEAGELYVNGVPIISEDIAGRACEGVIGIDEYAQKLFDNLKGWENYALPKGIHLKSIWWNRRYKRFLSEEINREVGRQISNLLPNDFTPMEKAIIKYSSYGLAKPKVLVCLDPFSGVDQTVGGKIKELLQNIADSGTAVVIISRQKHSGKIDYILNDDGTLHTAH